MERKIKVLRILLIFAVLALVAVTPVFFDLGKKYQELKLASDRIGEFAAVCDQAEAEYQANYAEAKATWHKFQEWYRVEEAFVLGNLKSSATPPDEIETCAVFVANLKKEFSTVKEPHLVGEKAVSLKIEFWKLVFLPKAEFKEAELALGKLQAARYLGYVEVYYRVWYPPEGAVDPGLAKELFVAGESHLDQGWERLTNSEWQLAQSEAELAQRYFKGAYEHASAPK